MIKCKGGNCPVKNLCRKYTQRQSYDATVSYYNKEVPIYQCEEMEPVNSLFKVKDNSISGAYFKITIKDNLLNINGNSISIKYYIEMADNILSGFKISRFMREKLNSAILELIADNKTRR